MADINSLSFGCGETLLAGQLNIMADAIRSLITLIGTIDDQVGSYIPLSGSEDISGGLAPNTNEGHNLGKSDKRWGTVWASTGGFKVIDFYDLQSPYGKLGGLYVGKDTSNNNETILHFKHGNNNEEIVATRDWVNSLLNPTRINIGSTGSISEELYNDESNYIKIESSSDNPIVIAGYDENTLPSGIKFGDASTGDVLTVYNGKIYVNGDIFGGENGVSVLNDLSNVNASAPTTGDFLMYNGIRWVSSPLPESLIIHPDDVSLNEEYYLMYEKTIEHPSGRYSWVERPPGANELNELDDVEIDYTKLELGQVLVYSQVTDEENNTYNSWVNKTLSGSLTYNQSDSNKYLKVKNDGIGTEWSDISLSDLSNTEIGGSNNALSNGLVLVYDSSSSNWKNTSLPANLPNTSTDNNGQYLTVENGIAKWVSVTPGSGLLWTDLTSSGNNIIDSSHLPTFNNNNGNSNNSGTSVGPTSNTLGTGNTLKVPKITYDKYGRITDATEHTITLPSEGGISDVQVNESSVVNNNIANIPLASTNTLGVVKIGVYGGLTLDNGFLKLNATNIGQNKTGLFLITDAGSTLSYSWVEVDLSNPANGNALIYDNGVWTCGNIIPTRNSNTNGYLKSTAGVLSWSPGSYTLPTANDSALGGIKIGYDETNSGTTKNYAVKLDINNKAYVNVPWTDSGNNSSNWNTSGNNSTTGTITSSGFIKIGKTNDEILLAGGGSKPLSDFTVSTDIYSLLKILNYVIDGNVVLYRCYSPYSLDVKGITYVFVDDSSYYEGPNNTRVESPILRILEPDLYSNSSTKLKIYTGGGYYYKFNKASKTITLTSQSTSDANTLTSDVLLYYVSILLKHYGKIVVADGEHTSNISANNINIYIL